MPFRPSLLVLLFPVLAGAEEFRLEDYQPAEFHRHYLAVMPGLFWNERGSGLITDSLDHTDGNAQTSSSLRLAFGSRAWAPEREWKLAADGYLQGGGSGSRNRNRVDSVIRDDAHGTDHGFLTGVHGQAEYRRSWGDWFLAPTVEVGVSGSPETPSRSWNWTRSPLPGTADSISFQSTRFRSRTWQHSESASLRLAFGFGRIVNVTFASTALFMQDRWAASGAPALSLDPAAMHDMEALLESRRKRRPFLDGRRAAIYDMMSVRDFLGQRGSAPPPEALLSMADEWNHPSPLPRERGWEIKAFPLARAHWYEDHQNSTQALRMATRPAAEDPEASMRAVDSLEPSIVYRSARNFRGSAEAGGGLQWEYRRPWRRFFQFDAETRFQESMTWVEMGESGNLYGTGLPGGYLAYRFPSAVAGGSASAAWIPDSRAYLRLSASVEGRRVEEYRARHSGFALPDRPTGQAQGGVKLEAWHEVAPRLGIHGQLSWSATWSDSEGYDFTQWYLGSQAFSEERHGHDFYATLDLTYYLF